MQDLSSYQASIHTACEAALKKLQFRKQTTVKYLVVDPTQDIHPRAKISISIDLHRI